MAKKKILMISDHQLGVSGVGSQSQWLVRSLIETGKYSFKCLGAAIKHNTYEVMAPHEDFVVKPIDGFGNPDMIRNLLVTERPDAMLIFNDPRFFIYLWEMVDEIRQVCPIAYWHLWDELPAPAYNRPYYDSTDLINCINYPTYEFLKEWYPERVAKGEINYIPHAVPPQVYHRLPDAQRLQIRKKLYGARAGNLLGLYVSRNARRKRTADVIASWAQFIGELEQKHGHRNATLVLHCDPYDIEGTNLFAIVDLYGLRDNVIFSNNMIEFGDMNGLYNSVDFIVNMSYNEGFGLPILEGQQCGVPAIVTRTGGLPRQVENWETGEQHGIVVEPILRTLVGQQMTPYIYEAYSSIEDYSKGYMRFYEMGPEGREELGQKAMKYVEENYSMTQMSADWDRTLSKLIQEWRPQTSGAWTCHTL